MTLANSNFTHSLSQAKQTAQAESNSYFSAASALAAICRNFALIHMKL
jgi:hypothetical protein